MSLSTDLERLADRWMAMNEQETPFVSADIAVLVMQNRVAIIQVLRIAQEAKLAGWIIREDGSITRPAYGADLMAVIEDANRIIGEQRRDVERMREALIKLRDCDWIITPKDRMDAVREIAREALGDAP